MNNQRNQIDELLLTKEWALLNDISSQALDNIVDDFASYDNLVKVRVLISLLFMPTSTLVSIKDSINRYLRITSGKNCEEWVKVISEIVANRLPPNVIQHHRPEDRETVAFSDSVNGILQRIESRPRKIILQEDIKELLSTGKRQRSDLSPLSPESTSGNIALSESNISSSASVSNNAIKNEKYTLPMNFFPLEWIYLEPSLLPSGYDIEKSLEKVHFTPKPLSTSMESKLKAASAIPAPNSNNTYQQQHNNPTGSFTKSATVHSMTSLTSNSSSTSVNPPKTTSAPPTTTSSSTFSGVVSSSLQSSKSLASIPSRPASAIPTKMESPPSMIGIVAASMPNFDKIHPKLQELLREATELNESGYDIVLRFSTQQPSPDPQKKEYSVLLSEKAQIEDGKQVLRSNFLKLDFELKTWKKSLLKKTVVAKVAN